MYQQVYGWFRAAILNRDLRPGQRLPSTRALAGELRISRITVLNAFEQLQAEGYLETALGSGTFVSKSIPDEMLSPYSGRAEKLTVKKSRSRSSEVDGRSRNHKPPWNTILGAFRVSHPSVEDFPVNVWTRLLTKHSRSSSRQLMGYGDAMGYHPFRKAITEYLRTTRGVRCDLSQVMVVNGSQQALTIAAQALLSHTKDIWLEEPGYPGARRAFGVAKMNLIPVPVDRQGLDVEKGIRLCSKAKAAYITPSHQYPLGMAMTARRRMMLLDWASRKGSWIIEDDYDSEYRFGSRPLASLQGMDTNGRVIYIGTFSKVLFPAIRLGYMVIPHDLISTFVEVRDAVDIFSSTLYQSVLTEFINEGYFLRHIRNMRILYLKRRRCLEEALRKELGSNCEIEGDDAGMHLVLMLPKEKNDVVVARRAAELGISATPLSACFLESPPKMGLILGYGGADEAQIIAGVKKLGIAIRSS